MRAARSLTAEQQAHYIHELADGFVVFSRPELRLAAPTGAWWYPALCEKKLPLGLPPLGAALWLLRLVPRLLKAMWVAWGCVKVEWTFGQYLVAIWFWPLPHMWRYYQAIRRVVTDPELVAKFDPATVSFVSDLRFFFQNQHTCAQPGWHRFRQEPGPCRGPALTCRAPRREPGCGRCSAARTRSVRRSCSGASARFSSSPSCASTSSFRTCSRSGSC